MSTFIGPLNQEKRIKKDACRQNKVPLLLSPSLLFLLLSSTYMKFVKWIVIESSYDKNYSGVAKETPRGLLASVVPGVNHQISLLDSSATLSMRIPHVFCGVEELSAVIPVTPKPGVSIRTATCWVAPLRFNGVWIWVYHHLWEDRKGASITDACLHLLSVWTIFIRKQGKQQRLGMDGRVF